MHHRSAAQAFARPAAIAMLVIAIISGFIPALQGILLPQLVSEGRLSLAELGRVAMAEAIGTLVAVLLATALLTPKHLRWIIAASAVLGLLLDLATAQLHGGEILAARFAHGLCAGLLLWVWVGFLNRTDNPARWIAAYVTCQAATVMGLSYGFTTALMPWGGAMAGFAVVAGLYGLMLPLALLAPREFAPLAQMGGSVLPGAKGWIALGAVFCQVAAILAVWVYLKPLGQRAGLSDATIGLAITLALGSQIFAGLCATAIAGRVRAGPLLITVSAVSVVIILGLGLSGSSLIFTFGAVLFAFFWMFSAPFQMPYLIHMDASRRTAVHMSSALLLGVAVGPALASLAVSQSGLGGALWVAGLLYGLTALMILLNRPAPA